MSNFITPIGEQDIRTTSTAAAGIPLGAYGGTPDGRVYRYGSAGGTDLDPGKVNVTPAVVANHQNRTLASASAANSFLVEVSIGATAATLDQYKDGFLTVNDSTGEGISYRVEGNDAASGSDTLRVRLVEPVKVALTTSASEVTLHVNPLSSVIIAPGALAHRTAGVNNVTVDDADYAWFQVRGYCSVLSDGVIAKGIQGIVSDAVNGAVETRVDATTADPVCVAIEATVDTEYRTVDLIIA